MPTCVWENEATIDTPFLKALTATSAFSFENLKNSKNHKNTKKNRVITQPGSTKPLTLDDYPYQ